MQMEGTGQGQPRWAVRLAAGLGVVFTLLAALYSAVTPLWEAPDEVGHFDYVAHLLTERALPVQRIGELGETHQPPLYYALAALLAAPADLTDATGGFRLNPRFMFAGRGGQDVNISLHGTAETFPFRGQALGLHLARLASVLMALVTVLLTVALGWRLFPERPLVGLLAGALTAFNPQFLFISGAVNNDNLLVLAATGVWWQVTAALHRPEGWRPWLPVGLWLAVAMLAKTSGLLVAVGVGVALAALGWRRRSFRWLVRAGAAVALPVLLLTAAWFIRNQVVYGDPLGWNMYQQLGYGDVQPAAFGWSEARDYFTVQFQSFWGLFGWMNIPAPGWFYGLTLLLVLAGIGGLVWRAARGEMDRLKAETRLGLLVLAGVVVGFEVMMTAITSRCDPSCYQGRYLFPVIAPAMLLVSYGLLSLAPRAPTRVAGGVALVMAGLALYTPFGVIQPAYQFPTLPKWRAWLIPHPVDVTVTDLADLRGYRVDTGESHVTLTLYWQARRTPDFDYSVFAHLINAAGEVVAQADHAPGEQTGYPPSRWQPEDLVADEHRVELPPDLPSGMYRFRVGMYNWQTGRQLPLASGDTPLGTFLILDQTIRR